MRNDQLLLAWAFRCVQNRLKEGQISAKYRTAVLGAPAFIQTCGLVQAVVFFKSKPEAEAGYKELLDDLSSIPGLKTNDILLFAQDADNITYQRSTHLVQRALAMLKRVVEGYPSSPALGAIST